MNPKRPGVRKPPAKKEPVVLRRFGTTGKPVPVPRRTNDLAKREGYGMFEDATLKLPVPPSIRGQLDNRQGEAAAVQAKRRAAAAAKVAFRPDAMLDPSQVKDRRPGRMTPSERNVQARRRG